MRPICLTIAGSDPSSGAGVQADIRTIDRIGVYPFSVITAITYQTAKNFFGFKSLSDCIENQLNAILTNYPVKYIKIGMIPDLETLEIITRTLRKGKYFIVYDPVTISSAGERLSTENLEQKIEELLFPLVNVLTPNYSEALFYSNHNLKDLNNDLIEDYKNIADLLVNKIAIDQLKKKQDRAIIIKGINLGNSDIADLALIEERKNEKSSKFFKIFKKRIIPLKRNVHGTGCVFSSAITAYLSKGFSLKNSIKNAEQYFDIQFQKFIELPGNGGYVLDFPIEDNKLKIINQIKEIYNFISEDPYFSQLIPEVRMNISGALPNAIDKSDIAAIEGRITIISGHPYAAGEIKFGVSDHTARLILTAKKFDNSINFVLNLKYKEDYIKKIEKITDLKIYEFIREKQPDKIRNKEKSTMQYLINECYRKYGCIPDIIWDKGAIGKEPMIRLFGKDSKDIIYKLKKIIDAIKS